MLKRHCLTLLLLLFPPAVCAIDPDSLLIASIGGPQSLEKLRQVKSYRVEGSALLHSLEGTFVLEYVYPDRFRLQFDLEPLTIAQGYDGRTAWQKDMNGAVYELAGYEKREMMKQLYFQSYSHLFDDRLPGGKEYRNTTVINGRTCHQVALYPLFTDTVLVYLDVETGLPNLSVSRLDEIETYTYSTDYRSVSGIMMPFASRAEALGTPLVTEFFVDTVILNGQVDTMLFAPPIGTGADYRFPKETDRVSIPLDFDLGHLYVTATINGVKKVRLILDTGASANILNRTAVADMNLPVIGSVPARGIGGYDEVQLVSTDSISIGQLILLNQVAGTANLPGIGRDADDGIPFGGVLGFDFFSRFPVMVDYRDEMLTVFSSENFREPPGGTVIPFHLTMQVPTIEAEIVGFPGDFLVDLGNAFGLVLHERFVAVRGLDSVLEDVQPLSQTLAGIGGSIKGRSAYAASFAFGNIRVQSLRVMLTESGQGLSGSEELAGNIGNLMLERFRILFDYRNNRMVFYEGGEDPN